VGPAEGLRSVCNRSLGLSVPNAAVPILGGQSRWIFRQRTSAVGQTSATSPV